MIQQTLDFSDTTDFSGRVLHSELPLQPVRVRVHQPAQALPPAPLLPVAQQRQQPVPVRRQVRRLQYNYGK